MKEKLWTCSKMASNTLFKFANACIHAEDNLLVDTSFDLTDKKGILAAKMKIVLSRISRSDDSDNIEEFMKKLDDDVSLVPVNSLPSDLSTLGQVLKSTKAIMDRFSQVIHLSSLNVMIVNWLIEVIRYIRYSMHRGPLFLVFTR